MKTISVVIPTYNEEENIEDAYHRVKALFDGALSSYRYEIIYIDNDSSDCSRKQIQMLCAMDQGVKAIFNAKILAFLAPHIMA